MKKNKAAKKKDPPTGEPTNMDDVLSRIASIKDGTEDPESIKALEAATAILTALQDEGINDREEVLDLVADYNALAEQYRTMHMKYEEPAEPFRLGAERFCPECHSKLFHSQGYCPGCGKRLKWR